METVVPDMKLSPNVGSDRSWVWNAAADVSEGEPEACTLAIRFANAESKSSFITLHRSCALADTKRRCQPVQGGFHQGTAGERSALQEGIDNCPCGASPDFDPRTALRIGRALTTIANDSLR